MFCQKAPCNLCDYLIIPQTFNLFIYFIIFDSRCPILVNYYHYIFWCFYFGYLYINNCCVFLMNFHLYHYIQSIFVSSYLFFAWSLFCLIQVWLHLLYFGCPLLGVSPSIPSLLAYVLSLELKFVFWKQHIIGSCFLIYPATLCLLIGEFNSFTFRVTIDRWGLSTVILSFVLWMFYISIFFVCISVCHFVLVVFYDIFQFSLFYISCLCSMFSWLDFLFFSSLLNRIVSTT